METKESVCLKYSVKTRVRYADVDKMGIVYNGNYLRLFEIGRTELMRHYGIPYSEIELKGYILPLVEAKIQWKGSAKYDDVLEIQTIFDPQNVNSTIKFDYTIKVENKTIAVGYTIHSFVRADSFRAVKPPKFFLETIQEITKANNI